MQKRTLYIGNLAYTAVEEDLEQAFEQFGVIEDIKLMRDQETGRSRGFAFITFESEDQAGAARAMDGTELAGRALRVSEARRKERKRQHRPDNKQNGNSVHRQPESFNRYDPLQRRH